MAIYTLPKKYHPDFSNPREKPVGSVELDLEDYYAKRLLFSVVPTSQKGYLDLVSGEIPTNTNVSISPKDGDIAAIFNDSDSKLVFDNSKVLISNIKPWTICWRGKLDLYGSQEHDVCSLKSTAVNSFTLIHFANGSYRDINWGMASSDFEQLRVDFDSSILEEDTVYFLSFDGVDAQNAGSYSVFINKSELSIVSGGPFGGIANTTIIGNGNVSGSNAYGGYQKFLHVFDFDFDQEDVTRFFDNQWRILKPSSPARYFTVDGVGGGISIPVIMNQYRQRRI